MAQIEAPSPPAGSIADVAARLALWTRRAPKGLARVEFVSDFSRRDAVTALRAALPESLSVHEIELPFQKPPLEVVHFLRERLRELPPGIISVTGFAAAFSADCPLEDALRVLNFHREELAQFPLRQIWWMTSPFTDAFLRFIPDLDSWFLVRLTLSEVIVDESMEKLPFDIVTYSMEEARNKSADVVGRFEKAINADPLVSDFVYLAYEAIFVLGRANLVGEQQKLAKHLLDEMIPILRSKGLLKKNALFFDSNLLPFLEAEHFRLSEIFRMLGYFCQCADKNKEAEKFYKAALEIASKLSDYFIELDNIFQSTIDFYISLSRFSEAEAICKQWIEVKENEYGRNDDFLLFPLSKLSVIYLSAEKYKEAEQVFYRMLFLAKTSLYPAYLEAVGKNCMLWFCKRLGRYAEAEVMIQQAALIPDEK